MIGARHNLEWTHASEVAKLFRNWPIVATQNGIVITVFYAIERMALFESDFCGDVNDGAVVEAAEDDDPDQDQDDDTLMLPRGNRDHHAGSEVQIMMSLGCLFCDDDNKALRLVLHNRRTHGLKAVLNALLAGSGPKVACCAQPSRERSSSTNGNNAQLSVDREQVAMCVELNRDPQDAYRHARRLVLSWSKHRRPGQDAQAPASNSVTLSSNVLARVPVFETLQPGTLACLNSSQFAVKAGVSSSVEKLGRKGSAAFRFSQEPLVCSFATHTMNAPVRALRHAASSQAAILKGHLLTRPCFLFQASTAPADVDTAENENRLSQWERLLLPHIPQQLLDLRSSDSVHLFRIAEGQHSPEACRVAASATAARQLHLLATAPLQRLT